MNQLQAAFESLVENPDTTSSNEYLKALAIGLWFENFTPDIKSLNGADAAQAGFMLDKLTRFNCLNRQRKDFLRDNLLSVLLQRKSATQELASTDRLAVDWGAKRDMKQQFRALLSYQTRHYALQYNTAN
jgi:hypothetical protein